MTATATRTQPSVDEAIRESEAAVLARKATTIDEPLTPGERAAIREERLAEQRVVRHLINGGNPDDLFDVPEEAAFESFDESEYEPADPPQESPDAPPATIEREFLIAPELERIGKMLIRKLDEFEPIRSTVTIAWYWKRQGGQEYGLDKLGGCKRLTGMEREKVGADFLVWLAADHLSKGMTTNEDVERLLYHQISHCSVHWKTGKPRIKPHHFAGFYGEERRYGVFSADFERVAKQPTQTKLDLNPADNADEAEGDDAA